MGWYNANWLYRKKLSVDHTKVSANETDFPVLVKLASDADLASDARSDGYDFVITQSDGTTECAYDRRYFNDTTGQLILFFKANSISSSVDTDFYIYYGNSGQATDKADRTTTWSNYASVWPLDESSSTRADITSSSNDLTDINSNVGQATGKIYQAAEFDDANTEYLKASITSNLAITGDITFQTWINLTTHDSTSSMINGADDNNPMYQFYLTTSNLGFYFNRTNGGGGTGNYTQSWSPSTSNWYLVTMVIDGTTLRFFVNDSQQGSDQTITQSLSTTTSGDMAVALGGNLGGGQVTDGLYENVLIKSGTTSGDWVATEYANQNSPSTFSSLGSEEYVGDVIVSEEVTATTLSLENPSVTTIKNPIINTSTQTGTFTLSVASIIGTANVSETTQETSLTLNSPTVSVGDGATPATIGSTLTAESPTVSTGSLSINGYNAFKVNNLKGIVDLDDGTLKVMLVDNTYTFDEDAHEFADDITEEITGTGYTSGGATLTGASVSLDTSTDTAKFDATDISWSSASFTAKGAIIYQDSGDPATSPLIAYFDFGANISPGNENLTIQWGDGIITYT